MTETATGSDQFTAFWNDVLAAKLERFRSILLDGLSYRSAVPLRTLNRLHDRLAAGLAIAGELGRQRPFDLLLLSCRLIAGLANYFPGGTERPDDYRSQAERLTRCGDST